VKSESESDYFSLSNVWAQPIKPNLSSIFIKILYFFSFWSMFPMAASFPAAPYPDQMSPSPSSPQ